MRSLDDLAAVGRVAATNALRDQHRMDDARQAGTRAIRDAVLDEVVADIRSYTLSPDAPPEWGRAITAVCDHIASLKGGDAG